MMGFGPGRGGGRGSPIAALLSLLAWLHLLGSLGAAAFIWDSHYRNRELVLGAYRVAWPAVSNVALLLILLSVVFQGLLVFAILQALGSMTGDLRAIRLATREGVQPVQSPASPPAAEGGAAVTGERLVRCDECGREFPEGEIVRHLGRNVCRIDYDQWLRGS